MAASKGRFLTAGTIAFMASINGNSQWYNPYVKAIVPIDKAGRLVLPKAIRDELRIGPGDSLEIESEDDRLTLQPVRVRPGLSKERGVWVYRSGTPVDTSIPALIDQERERRMRDLLAGQQ